jgi:hypothetical protein
MVAAFSALKRLRGGENGSIQIQIKNDFIVVIQR